jgi:predicted ATPase
MSRIKRIIDFNENEVAIKRQFLRIASELIGKEYIVRKENAENITALLRYFTGNKELDLNKGIYLYGPFGCGKTALMASIRKFIATYWPFNPNGFLSVSLEEIIEFYKLKNNLNKFGYNINGDPIGLCINEFGKTMDEKIYGTNADYIITSLFMIRYELFQSGKLTHVTSNFAPGDLNIEPIVKDRISEMFNFIELKGNSFR